MKIELSNKSRTVFIAMSALLIAGFFIYKSEMTSAENLEGGFLIESHIPTKLLPSGSLSYSVWEPESLTAQDGQSLPLIIFLHGGAGSSNQMTRFAPVISELVKEGTFPKAIWSSPDAERSLYMNYRDGSAMWEDVLINEYIPMLMKKYDIQDRKQVVLTGISMGGLGALRLAFKYPERFGAVAVLEPAIEPAFQWQELNDMDTFYRVGKYKEVFGEPVDQKYWQENNPIQIANHSPRKLDQLSIYFEVGNEDQLKLYRGGEFLHRVLFDHGVKHEYRHVHGADHISPKFMAERFSNLLGFVNRYFNPVEESMPMKAITAGIGLFIDKDAFGSVSRIPDHRK